MSYGAKVAISPPLALCGVPPKGLSEPSKTLATLPHPPGARGGEIAIFWDSFEAWEASEESQKLAILPPLTPGRAGLVSKGS